MKSTEKKKGRPKTPCFLLDYKQLYLKKKKKEMKKKKHKLIYIPTKLFKFSGQLVGGKI